MPEHLRSFSVRIALLGATLASLTLAVTPAQAEPEDDHPSHVRDLRRRAERARSEGGR